MPPPVTAYKRNAACAVPTRGTQEHHPFLRRIRGSIAFLLHAVKGKLLCSGWCACLRSESKNNHLDAGSVSSIRKHHLFMHSIKKAAGAITDSTDNRESKGW